MIRFIIFIIFIYCSSDYCSASEDSYSIDSNSSGGITITKDDLTEDTPVISAEGQKKLLLEKKEQEALAKLNDKEKAIIKMKKYNSQFWLKFDDVNAVKAGVFKREDVLWIVFNTKNTEDNLEKNELSPLISEQQHDKYKIIQVEIPEGVFADLQILRNMVVVKFVPKEVIHSYYKRPKIIEDKSEEEEDDDDVDNEVVFIESISNQDLIKVNDSDIGDELWLILDNISGRAFTKTHKYIDFHILPSSLGLVIKPLSNELEIRDIADNTGVEIATTEVFDTKDKNKEAAENQKDEAKKLIYDIDYSHPLYRFSVWSGKKNYSESIIMLRKNLLKVHPYKRRNIRIKIAELYLSHGLYQDALGYLDYIRSGDRKVISSVRYRLLYAAALYFGRNYSQAKDLFDTLDEEELSDDHKLELQFWKDAIDIKMGDDQKTLKYIIGSEKFLKEYNMFREEFAFMAFEQAINNDLIDIANKMNSIISAMKTHNVNRLLYNRAILLEKKQKYKDALKIYTLLSKKSDDRKYRSLAVYRKTKYLYSIQKVDRVVALKQLLDIKFVWSSPEFEVPLLKDIGDLYIEEKEYYKGMLSYKEMIKKYPGNKYIFEITKKMGELFIKLLIDDKDDTLLDDYGAALVFYEFKELMPVGSIGVKITLNFIDRLLDLDLVDQAEKLLEHLVNFRLKDKQRQLQRLKLSAIKINNHKYKAVIDLLNKDTDFDLLRGREVRERRYLLTDALILEEKYEEASEVIGSLSTVRGTDLRGEIFWRSKEWDQFMTLAEGVLEFRSDPKAPLTEREKIYVIRLALAYASKGQHEKIKSLEEAFSTSFPEDSKYRKSLVVFTEITDELTSEDLNKSVNIDRINEIIEAHKEDIVDDFSKISKSEEDQLKKVKEEKRTLQEEEDNNEANAEKEEDNENVENAAEDEVKEEVK